MSLYHIVFALLIMGAIWEHIRRETPRAYFLVCFLLLSAMLCFRFGQGTDYFNYAYIYHALPANPIAALSYHWIHSESGWKFICGLFRWLNFPFTGFVFLMSACMMLLFFRFLRLFGGQHKMLAMLIFYHTLYLSYFASAMRQGVVAAVFLGLMLPWLLDRRYILYYIVSALLVLIHSVAAVLLILPLLQGISFKFRKVVTIVVIGFLLGIVMAMGDFGILLSKILPIVYLGASDVSVVSLLERILTFGVVTFCYYTNLEGEEPDPRDALFILFKVYALGVFLYSILMWSSLISSRTAFLLKLVEAALLCACLVRCKKSGVVVLTYMMLLSGVLYIRNIDSCLEHGNYRNATVLDYPYVTVFNQKEILDYRNDTVNYPFP